MRRRLRRPRGALPIICSYAPYAEAQALDHKPTVVLLGEGNRIEQIRSL